MRCVFSDILQFVDVPHILHETLQEVLKPESLRSRLYLCQRQPLHLLAPSFVRELVRFVLLMEASEVPFAGALASGLEELEALHNHHRPSQPYVPQKSHGFLLIGQLQLNELMQSERASFLRIGSSPVEAEEPEISELVEPSQKGRHSHVISEQTELDLVLRFLLMEVPSLLLLEIEATPLGYALC